MVRCLETPVPFPSAHLPHPGHMSTSLRASRSLAFSASASARSLGNYAKTRRNSGVHGGMGGVSRMISIGLKYQNGCFKFHVQSTHARGCTGRSCHFAESCSVLFGMRSEKEDHDAERVKGMKGGD